MAIDTAAKRRAAGGVAFLPVGPGVTPNVAKPVTWRQQAAWSYSGIAPFTPATGSNGENLIALAPKNTIGVVQQPTLGGLQTW